MPTGSIMRGSMGRPTVNGCGCGTADSSSAMNMKHDFTGHMPVAMAYVPWEHFNHTYELEQAIEIGTIFPDLDKPFTGKGGNCS